MTNNIDRMLEHILFLARRFRGCHVKYITMMCLLDLGIEPKHDGYHYLTHLIVLYLESSSQVSIKNLYIAVAALYNGIVDADQVEQSIRSAIRKAWEKRDQQVWICYFKPNADGSIDKPSNAKFISRVACVLELWKGCCEAEKNQPRTEEGVL